MKKWFVLLSIIMMIIFSAACSKAEQNPPSESSVSVGSDTAYDTESDEDYNKIREVWGDVSGSFVREDSGQYNNAVLQTKYLENDCVMFEFKLMEGSESEDYGIETIIPGVLLIDAYGEGRFETDPDAVNPFVIDFTISDDGQFADVTHEGNPDISPDGRYEFAEDIPEVSDISAITILEYLPTAATGLGGDAGAYTVQYPEGLAADWFYPVEATSDINGVVISKFLIAKDLSAVFRADDDMEPVLVFGSAQPMMDAESYLYPDDDEAGDDGGEDAAEEDFFYGPWPIASVTLENGGVMNVGGTDRLIAVLPWELPYSISAVSSDEAIVTVDEEGTLTGVSKGNAAVSGTLLVDDGTKEFSIEISVITEAEHQNEAD